MKKLHVLKSLTVLGVLLCMGSLASAQTDIDVMNNGSCGSLLVKYLNDDATGTCTTCGSAAWIPLSTLTTMGCSTMGAVYIASVSDGVTAVTVGDCSLTSCSGCALPTSASFLSICGSMIFVDYYPPGFMGPNAYLDIY